MRLERLGRAMLTAMLVAAGPTAAADDVFTPLTAMPFLPRTSPVPGTDGKWHLVYELELANTRSTPATLEQIEVTAPRAQGDARPFRPATGAAEQTAAEVLATFAAETFAERLKLLDNQPAPNARIELGATRLFLIDLALTEDRIPTRLRHTLRLTGQGSDVTNPRPVEQSYSIARIDVARRLPVLRPPLDGRGWVAFNGCCAPGAHRSTVS